MEKTRNITGLIQTVAILLLFAICSCKEVQKQEPKPQEKIKIEQKDPTSEIQATRRLWKIPLLKDYGNIEITLPLHYDTVFSWSKSQHICGDSCAFYMYRVQNTRSPVYKEIGLGDYWPKDSVEQFTIEYSKIRQPTSIPDSLMIIPSLRTIRTLANIYKVKKLTIDTSFYINSNKIGVIGYSAYDSSSKTPVAIINAVTYIKGGKIEFILERRKQITSLKAETFLKESFESIRNMRIQ